MKLHHTANVEQVGNYGTRLSDIKREIDKLPPVFSDNAVIETRTGLLSVREDVDAAEMERRLVPKLPVPEGVSSEREARLFRNHEKMVDRHVQDLFAVYVGNPTFKEIAKRVTEWKVNLAITESDIYNSVTRLLKSGVIEKLPACGSIHYRLVDRTPEILIGATDDSDPAPVSAASLAENAITTEKIKDGVIGSESTKKLSDKGLVDKIAAQLEIHSRQRNSRDGLYCGCGKWYPKGNLNLHEQRKAHTIHQAQEVKDAL